MQDLAEQSEETPNFASSQVEQRRHITDIVASVVTANELHSKHSPTIFRITLDDAIEVLKELKVADSEDATNVKRVRTMLSKREFDDEQRGNTQRSTRDKRQRTISLTVGD